MRACELDSFVGGWLEAFRADRPYIRGAYRVGSTAELPGDSELGDCSDIDVMLVTEGGPAAKPGKLPYRGHVIEATYLPWQTISDPELALADYHIAHGLHLRRVLFDCDGALASLCDAVGAEFAKPGRVRQRVCSVVARIERNLDGYDPSADEWKRFMGLLFAAGVMAHAVLVADLKNPTVRMRYRAARRSLLEKGESAAYERLLAAAGFSDIRAEEARAFTLQMAGLFDLVAPARRTHLPFSSDLEPEMRASAVDDLLALIDSGQPREAMFWICATWARLLWQADADSLEIEDGYIDGFRGLACRIGIGTEAAERERIALIRSELPPLLSLCDRLIG